MWIFKTSKQFSIWSIMRCSGEIVPNKNKASRIRYHLIEDAKLAKLFRKGN